jgi:uncharacterized protein (TIGR02265 family)
MAGTTKGIYFIGAFECFAKSAGRDKVIDLCDKLNISVNARKRDEISITMFNVFIEEGVKLFWPKDTIERGMFRQGEAAFSNFANTLIGKTGLSLFGSHVRKLAERAPIYYAAVNKFGTVKYVNIDQNSFRLEFRNYESYPQLQHGIISCTTLRLEPKAKVDLLVHSFVNHGGGAVLTDFNIIIHMP